MTEEEKKQKELQEYRLTVHPGDFKIVKNTDDLHSLTPDEYRQKRLEELRRMQEMLEKKNKSL